MRKVVLSLSGAVAGAVLSVFLGPPFMTWWATPPFQIPGCDYRPAIAWAMKNLMYTQALFIVCGAVAVPLVVGLLFPGRKTEQPPG
jgi:hypothetical protein